MTTAAFITDQHYDLSSRWTEHLHIMEFIVRDLRERRPSVIALGGDIYERSPRPEEVRAACEWLVALGQIAPVVGVAGNHDPADSTAPFNHLASTYPIRFYEEPAVHVFPWGAIACLPWPQRAQLLATVGQTVSRDEANQVATDALRAILGGLGQQLDEVGGHRLFLGHVQLRGASISTGQPMAPGQDFELGPDDLVLVGADAYMLGHVHRSSIGECNINGAPCWYGGSSRRTAFGELEAKGFSWVDLAQRPAAVSMVETPCTAMLLGEDEWADGAWLCGWTGLDPEAASGAEIRMRYKVAADQRDAARAAASIVEADLLARGAMSVKIEEVVRPVSRARAPEIATAPTLPDQLTQLWALRGIPVTEERRGRLLDLLSKLEREAA